MTDTATAESATPVKKGFDFGIMGSLPSAVPSVEEQFGPPPEAEPVVVSAEAVSTEGEKKPEEDEDDLVVGSQLDDMPVRSESTTSAADTVVSATQEETVTAVPEADGPTDSDDPLVHGDTATLQNPNDPRLSALSAAGRQEAQQRMQERQAMQGMQGGGRAGGGGGGMGIGAAIGTGLVGGFKLLKNGVHALAAGDPSLPKRMSIAERRAMRDPVKAQEYFARSGEETLRESIYRDGYKELHSLVAGAKSAEREFHKGVEDMQNVLRDSPLKQMADDAKTSIGDYIHGIKSGTIQNAAAAALVQNLEQDSRFTGAEKTIIDAGRNFREKSEAALKQMDNLDTAFPGRLNTNLHRQQLANSSDGMKNDEVAKASSKVKEIMDDLAKLADAIKKAIMSVVDKVGSIFKAK